MRILRRSPKISEAFARDTTNQLVKPKGLRKVGVMGNTYLQAGRRQILNPKPS